MKEKKSFWLWLLALFRKDMSNFKEDEGDKQAIYKKVRKYMGEEKK